jgi:membrane-associated protease RseP (regulator of RpoE activity)
MVRVAKVTPGSIAEEIGILPGTELVSIDGREIRDFLDWEFLSAEDEVVVEARLPDGEEMASPLALHSSRLPFAAARTDASSASSRGCRRD